MAKEKISEEQKVNHILGSFEDHHVADWASTQTAVLTAMKFTDFMKNLQGTLAAAQLGTIDPLEDTEEPPQPG